MYQVSVVSEGKTLKVFFTEDHGDLPTTMKIAKLWADGHCPGASIEPQIVGCL